MDKEAFLQDKKQKVTKLFNQQKILVNESVELHKGNSNIAEIFPILLSNSFKIRLLEIQKQTIISQPFPKFDKGTSAIINETGPELINVNSILSRIFTKEAI